MRPWCRASAITRLPAVRRFAELCGREHFRWLHERFADSMTIRTPSGCVAATLR